LSNYNSIIVDTPQEKISRITLNRPKQRNSLSAELRTELFQVLENNDLNEDISVTIIRGSGESFSARL
jgi:Enoyl-CoA hydratase/carnithine racemase